MLGFDAIGSTNTEAREAALAGDPGGVWFAALQQTEGRGRRGRAWQSPAGNLAATLLVILECEPALAATLGFVAGVALHRAIAKVAPATHIGIGVDGADAFNGRSRVALKWPNDVLVDGAKLAGILLEAIRLPEGRHAVAVGLGVNIVAAPTGLPYPATCLSEIGTLADAETMFETLSDSWVEIFGLWNDGRGVADVLELWRQLAAGLGADVAVNRDGVVLRGIFETIDPGGRLILRAADDERIAITAGDVHFGVTATAR
ncbi:MAG: biotin--[acetyl-CoA-carboxylase] ligase [Devosia sp.]|nr:biotin--[acetyl-CoA-carboxylase] ligase [Devosia sp.]